MDSRKVAEELFLTRSMFHNDRVGAEMVITKLAHKLHHYLVEAKREGMMEAVDIAHKVCSTCPDEDGDFCPASNHWAARRIEARAQEVK